MNKQQTVISILHFAQRKLGLSLYKWQAEACVFSVTNRRRMALVAANGSGKTACVNVVLLLWFLYTFPRGIAMVTSGSWNQLTTQLWPNLEMHREKFPGWKWGKDKISTPQGGFIRAYSTNHPGRAEGHHEHLPERPVMLMVDEAKSVPEPIFEALSRCTPTYYVLTSSPGQPSGSFYNAFHKSRKLYHSVHVDALMCPHIPEWKITLAQQLYGPDYERHPIYRSMIMGLFTEGDDSMLIPRYLVERALMHKPAARTGERKAAVDWAAGGDETVLAERNGNQLRILWRDREKDTVTAAQRVVHECRQRGIEDGDCMGDVCGLGKGIMDAAKHYQEYYFKPFNGGALPANEKDRLHYADLNAQAWMYFRQSLERGEVCFPDGLDEETIDQLCNRYMQWGSRGQVKCEPKKEMKESRGLSSPDRADALIMAWWAGRFMTYDDEAKEEATAPAKRGFVI